MGHGSFLDSTGRKTFMAGTANPSPKQKPASSYKLGPLTPQEIESLRQDKRDSLKRLGEIFQRSASQPAPK